jgi:hypothetical protein
MRRPLMEEEDESAVGVRGETGELYFTCSTRKKGD